MIHFDDWLLTKDEGPVIARQFDNLTRRLEILGDIPEGWSWTLLVQAGTHLDIIALAPMDGGLGVDLTAEMLAIGGYYKLQLKGTKGELVRHTNQLRNVLIPASLSGDANWPEIPSEFSQAEARIRELNEHPPYPGDAGYWMVWDLETDTYIQSPLPLPPVAEGPPGNAATITVGETITGDPDTPAKVENTGTENAAVLRFVIPRGAVGPTGATPAISVEVTGLPAGSEPTVEVSGTPEAPVIALGIPQGKQGDTGAGVPPADDVPTDYLLSVGGWVPPPSGGGSGDAGAELIFETTVTGLHEYRVTDIDFDTNVVTIDPPYEGQWGYGALTVCVKPESIKDFESGVPKEIKALYGSYTTNSYQLLDSTHIQFPTITKMDTVNLDTFYMSKTTVIDAINLPAFDRARICISLENGGTFGLLGLKSGNSLLPGVVYSLSGKAYGYYAESKLIGIGYQEIIIDGNQIYTLPCEYLEASTQGVLSVKTGSQHTCRIKPDTVFNGFRIAATYGGFVNGSIIKIIKER